MNPELAWRMAHTAVESQAPLSRVTVRSIYGDYRRLRL
jgi:hypothetical protein